MDLPLITAAEPKAILVLLNRARSFVERTKHLMYKTPPVLHQIITREWLHYPARARRLFFPKCASNLQNQALLAYNFLISMILVLIGHLGPLYLVRAAVKCMPHTDKCTHNLNVSMMSSLDVSFSRRVLLSIMYLMVETIRVQTEDDRPEWIAARETFKNELGVCVCVYSVFWSCMSISFHWLSCCMSFYSI